MLTLIESKKGVIFQQDGKEAELEV